MDRPLDISLFYMLGLISTAEDYGYQQLLPDFWEMIGEKLSEEEIGAYAQSVLDSSPEYGEEDYESIVYTLTEFKEKYSEA